MDHGYLNSSANLWSLEFMEHSKGIRLNLPNPAAPTVVDLEAASGQLEGGGRADEEAAN